MYCLDQFFYQLTYILYEEQHVLKQWHPMLKKWCIKIVLFFSTYQNVRQPIKLPLAIVAQIYDSNSS